MTYIALTNFKFYGTELEKKKEKKKKDILENIRKYSKCNG